MKYRLDYPILKVDKLQFVVLQIKRDTFKTLKYKIKKIIKINIKKQFINLL